MERDEVLDSVSKKKVYVGEMEKEKVNKSMIISLIATGVLAVGFIIVLAILGNAAGAYVIATIAYFWAAAFYALQFFVAKRPWPVLFGAFFHGLAFVFFLVRFILLVTGVWC